MNRQREVLKTIVALNRVNANLDTIMRKDIQSHELNVNEFAVLELLFHKGPQKVQTIKEKILVANSSTTYLLNKLTEKGLCKRELCSKDKRISYIDLTDKGRAFIENVFPKHADMLVNAFGKLNDDEIKQLRDLLKKLSGIK